MAGLPPGINLADDVQNEIIGSISATWALATIAMALRFACRRISKAGFWWDDYLMIPAYLFTSILSWVSITWMIQYGLGKHIFVQAPIRIPKAVEVFLKSLFISEVCYTGTIVFAKFSILAFYWRLFSRNTFVRWSVIAITGIVTCWGIAVFIIVVAQCRPLKAFWDMSLPRTHCTVDSYKFFYGNSVPNIVTDLLLILAPFPAIWSLSLQLRQKISLSGIFLLGLFITAVSITRLIYLVTLDINDPDVTWVFSMAQIWTCVELNVAVLCGCLPQLRPLLLLITTGSLHGSTNASGKGSHGTGSTSMRDPKAPSPQSKLETVTVSVAGDDTRPLVSPTPAKGAGYIELHNVEHGNTQNGIQRKGTAAWDINVRTDWNISSTSSRPGVPV